MCPVCGFDALSGPPYEQYGDPVPFGSHGEPLEVGSPTHVICSSCGFHFGYHDEMQLIGVPGGLLLDELDLIFRRWREAWIAGGMKFWMAGWETPPWKTPPPEWDPIAQLRRVGHDVSTDP
jgi:hypothetical protein